MLFYKSIDRTSIFRLNKKLKQFKSREIDTQ